MIVQGLNALVQFVSTFFTTLATLGKWLLDGVLYVLKGALYFGYDGVLTVIQGMITAVNFSTLVSSIAGLWAGLSPQLIFVINQCGIPAGLTMISGAISIRLALNLIPAEFTRL